MEYGKNITDRKRSESWMSFLPMYQATLGVGVPATSTVRLAGSPHFRARGTMLRTAPWICGGCQAILPPVSLQTSS